MYGETEKKTHNAFSVPPKITRCSGQLGKYPSLSGHPMPRSSRQGTGPGKSSRKSCKEQSPHPSGLCTCGSPHMIASSAWSGSAVGIWRRNRRCVERMRP